MSEYDNGNVFARILRADIPATRIFETDELVAIMDAMPQSEGHCLVIPRAPARNLFDASDETLALLLPAAARLARAARRAFDADGVALAQYNEAAAGQTVFHLHLHVIPRYEGRSLLTHAGGMADPALLSAQADRIRAALD